MAKKLSLHTLIHNAFFISPTIENSRHFFGSKFICFKHFGNILFIELALIFF